MPHALHVMLLVLAWTSLPLWPVVIAGIWLFEEKGVIVAVGSEALCTFCALIMFLAARTDKHIRLYLKDHIRREQTLVLALDRLSETATQPQPVLRAVRR